jgi:hypothetical protein
MSEHYVEPFGFKTKLHHHAYLVRTGMMIGATTLMQKLGFICFHELVADWGQLRDFGHLFSGLPVVQLIEDKNVSPDQVGIESDTPHLGIQVSGASAIEAATEILDWLHWAGGGKDARMEAADNTGRKIFLYIPALLRFAIELVWVEGMD